MQLEVGKKYVCRYRPDIKYIEITRQDPEAAHYLFGGTVTYTSGDKQEQLLSWFTPEGRFWVDVLSKEDLVAEYGADTIAAPKRTIAAPKRTIDEVRAFINDTSWIEEAIEELDEEEDEERVLSFDATGDFIEFLCRASNVFSGNTKPGNVYVDAATYEMLAKGLGSCNAGVRGIMEQNLRCYLPRGIYVNVFKKESKVRRDLVKAVNTLKEILK